MLGLKEKNVWYKDQYIVFALYVIAHNFSLSLLKMKNNSTDSTYNFVCDACFPPGCLASFSFNFVSSSFVNTCPA